MDRVYKEERNYILNIVKKIKASGCNVLLIQKSILRDAVTDLALHYLVGGAGARAFSETGVGGACDATQGGAEACGAGPCTVEACQGQGQGRNSAPCGTHRAYTCACL